ncbi:MAG: dihydrolipoamide acetyltransferase family protein [Chloroflexota bacterium]
MIEIRLPKIDDNVLEYTIGRWLKAAGDTVVKNEPILEVETDKVTMEVVAEESGILAEIKAQEGDVLQPDAVLAVLTTDSETMINSKPEVALAAAVTTPITSKASRLPVKQKQLTPVVARMVAEHAIDIDQINGSGRNGRITKKDVLRYLKTAPHPPNSPSPHPPISPSPTEEKTLAHHLPLSPMRKSIAEHMVRSLATSPHVTTLFEFDLSAVKAHRAAHRQRFADDGVKLTYMAYFTQATAIALKKFPLVNSQFSDGGILLKKEINIGMIVAVEDGLYAPVIQHADEYNLKGLARAIGEHASKARSGRLTASNLSGGTFTISNHGSAGSIAGTPIIFQPQAGILGIGAIEDRVKVINGGIQIRPCCYISFSFDHRVMDGAIADGFCAEVKRIIEVWPESIMDND